MKNTLVILIKGPLETLNTFVDCIHEELINKSIECHVIDVRDTGNLRIDEINRIISGKNAVVLSFNNIGSNLTFENGNYWKYEGITFYSWIVDHPRNYDAVLADPPCDMNVLVLDENHKLFVDRFFPRIHQTYVMHYGGNEKKGDSPLYKNRKYDVVYLGTNGQSVNGFPLIDEFEDKGRDFYEYTVSHMLADTSLTTEESIEMYFRDRNKDVSGEYLLKIILDCAGHIENYVRREIRFHGISELDSMGINVDIWGNPDSWVSDRYQFSDRICVHDRISPDLMPEILSDTKISLCYTPWFKKGYSEKQPDSMVNGALCVSDRNGYTEKNYSDGKDLIIFDLDDQYSMAQSIAYYLHHLDEAELIANRGRVRARELDNWNSRVNELIAIFENGEKSSDKISIVIPCYNCAQSVMNTWDSIKKQSIGINRLECIFVDDASTDAGATWNALQLIEAECPGSVMIIHLNENMRQGGARNVGISYASGEYLMFVDSDDTLMFNACETAFRAADETKADIVMFNHRRTLGDQNRDFLSIDTKAEYLISEQKDRIPFLNSTIVDYGCWNKMYKMSLVRKSEARFAEHAVYEEPLFVYPCFLYAERVTLIPDVLYIYNLHEGSTVTSSLGKNLLDHPRVQLELLEYCLKQGDIFAQYRDVIGLHFLWSYYCETLCFAGQHAGALLPLEYYKGMQEVCRSFFGDWRDNPLIKQLPDMVKTVLESIDRNMDDQEELNRYVKKVAELL